LRVQGRHDPCIVPRAAPCVEAAAAIALYDAYAESMGVERLGAR
jgi:chorismate synthase